MTAATDPSVKYCPSCGGRLRPEAVLCIHCGMDLRAGEQRVVDVEQQTRELRIGTTPRAVGLALVTGVGLVGIWAAIVMLTGLSIGYLVIPIGLIIGLVFADQIKQGGWKWGGLAAALAGVTLLAGQIVVGAAGYAAVAERDVQADPQYLQAAIIRSMAEQRAFSPEVQAALDARREGEESSLGLVGPSLDERVANEARQRLAELTPAQHRTLARELIADVPEASLAGSGIGVLFTRWDAIWLVLGIACAGSAADAYGRRLSRRRRLSAAP